MSDVRRALCWFLVVALFTIGAFIVAAPKTADDVDPPPLLVTTPSTTEPVIAHIEEP